MKSERGKVPGLRVVDLGTGAQSCCFGKELHGPAPGKLSETELLVDLVFQPKGWDCETWVVKSEWGSAEENWSA